MNGPQLTKNAIKNHEELFPNHESKLQKTDPEFIELFDNWAFDEVIRQSNPDDRQPVVFIWKGIFKYWRTPNFIRAIPQAD